LFAKIFRSMFQGSMYGNPDGIITFMVMLVLAERHGEVDMTPQAIAAVTSIPLTTIQAGIAYLSAPDPETRTHGSDGRRIELLDTHRNWGWRIVNYEHYRQIRNEEERREYQADWARKARANRSDARVDSVDIRGVDNPSTSRRQRRQLSTMSTNADADADADAEKNQRARATRLPDDFQLSEERTRVATDEGLEAPRVFASFVDYFKGLSGSKATKHDWDATWRNWCRKEASFGKGRTALQASPESASAQLVWSSLVASDGANPPRTAAIQEAIEACGGWQAIRMRTPFDEPKLKARFVEAYRA
jgi:hypothetical protein